MTDPLIPEADGGTKLTDEEREGLIPSYITLRSELNEAEQANILEAEQWAFARNRDPLDEKFLDKLHKRMFGRNGVRALLIITGGPGRSGDRLRGTEWRRALPTRLSSCH